MNKHKNTSVSYSRSGRGWSKSWNSSGKVMALYAASRLSSGRSTTPENTQCVMVNTDRKSPGGFETNESRFNTWAESHFDLDEGFITISQKIFGFSVVDPHHAQEKMARRTQSHFHLFRRATKTELPYA